MFTINYDNIALTIASWIALWVIFSFFIGACWVIIIEFNLWHARRKQMRENELFFQNVQEFYNDIG